MNLRFAGPGDLASLARIHAAGFEAPWSASELASLMTGTGVANLMAEDDGALGFVLMRVIAGEAEVLTIAVDPPARRRGVGAALMTAAAGWARAAGAGAMFLEAAADNPAALALYAALQFQQAGVRRGYYMRRGGPPTDARVLRRALNSIGP